MIPKVGNPYDEQETIINIDPKQISDRASVYTTIPAMINRMWALHEKYPEDVLVTHDDKYGSEFTVPRDWVKIKPKRQMTEEEKQALAARLNSGRTEDDDE